jgi:mercuric ion transport protein
MKYIALIGTGLVSAIAASLCCIAPILALIAGTGSAAFSWIAPGRPYLIVFTTGTLAFAWYQALKTKSETDECGCAVEKPSFFNSKTFLGIVTLLAVIMLSFPYLLDNTSGTSKNEMVAVDINAVQKIEIGIIGMTCEACEGHIKQAIDELNGIKSVVVSYNQANAVVEFDTAQVSNVQIKDAILSTGYKIIETKN